MRQDHPNRQNVQSVQKCTLKLYPLCYGGYFVPRGLSLDRDQGTSMEGTVERYLQKQ
jgi:hypothetical protein